MFVRLRLPVFLLLAAGIFAGGWWLGKNSAAGPAQPPAHSATAQLPPPSAHPPGYLTSKAPPTSPAAGAEALAKLLEQRAKPEDLATALAAWAEQDPDAAFRALLADPRLKLPETARALFEVLGKNDPAKALQRLAQLPAVPWARDANRGLATGWTQLDPQAATTAGLTLPPGTRRVDFLQTAFSQWMRQDITAAKDWLMSLPPGESRARIITYDTVRNAQVHNAQEMAALLELAQSNFPERENITSESFDTWSTQSPDDAHQWALALPYGLEFTTKFLSAALEPFAADPDRVLSLLPQLMNPEARERLVESAANAWAQRDPIGAWVWAAQLTDPSQRKAFEDRLTFQWGELDAETAIPWLLKNQANQLEKINSRVLTEWAEASPDAGLSMIDQLPVENAHEEFITSLLEGIAAAKPAIALSHLDLLKENQYRSSVIYKAMSTWSEQDITAASAYTDALPPGSDRQAAIGGILGAAFDESPESAFTWALSLTDPIHKSRELDDLLTRWRKKDPAAAQNWLDHAPLDDALRQKLTPSQP